VWASAYAVNVWSAEVKQTNEIGPSDPEQGAEHPSNSIPANTRTKKKESSIDGCEREADARAYLGKWRYTGCVSTANTENRQ